MQNGERVARAVRGRLIVSERVDLVEPPAPSAFSKAVNSAETIAGGIAAWLTGRVQAIQDFIVNLDNVRSAPLAAGGDERRTQNLEPIAAWRSFARTSFWTVGVFSVFVNLLMLTMPIYLFQISDRVLTSRSFETLLMLSGLAIGLIAVLSLLDLLRRQVLGRLATTFETTLGGPVLASIVASAPTGAGASVQAIRSLQQVKGFLASPTMLLLFDAPLSPLYFGVVFLVHPYLGWIALLSGIVLIAIAIANQRATASPMAQAGKYAAKAEAQAESLARNSQVINAMGMLNESIEQWGRDEAMALKHQSATQDRNFWISGSSKFARLVTQILILGFGANLALKGELTGGMMIAASIIAGRALQPLEGLIEGWRSLVQSRNAYAMVIATVEALKNERPRLLLPRPTGQLSIDRVLYIPPGSKEPIINGVSFELRAGESLAIVGPSGSGKSTLARIMVGCLYPTAGKVRLDGTELRNWDRRQFGQFTGYLPQEVELFPGTIRDNVCRMRSTISDEQVFQASVSSGRARHDRATASGLRDFSRKERRTAFGWAKTTNSARASLLWRAIARCTRRAELEPRRIRRTSADRNDQAGEAARRDVHRHNPETGNSQYR